MRACVWEAMVQSKETVLAGPRRIVTGQTRAECSCFITWCDSHIAEYVLQAEAARIGRTNHVHPRHWAVALTAVACHIVAT
jgi:hypothetical protein